MPSMMRPVSRRRLLGIVVIGLYVLACTVIDLFPRYGPPDFRYTGSDPAFVVWNFGWPVALLIYDSRNGLHVGPMALPVAVLEGIPLAFVVAVAVAIRLLRRPGSRVTPAPGTPPGPRIGGG